MLTPQLVLPLARGIWVDLFAGGGGASSGIERAIGRPVDLAINHDPEAICLHTVNHPQTEHLTTDIREVDPLVATRGRPVDGLWASFDCRHFSRAKGGQPRQQNIRSLAWVVVDWARAVRPTIIHCECVIEFRDWAELLPNGMQDKTRRGETFRRWVADLEALGYKVEWRELRGCDFGAPTTRNRWYMIARCDGEPIVWPEPTHAPPVPARPPRATKVRALHAAPASTRPRRTWRTAAECIDWRIACPSIFGRKRLLAEATMRRVAKGIIRYVLQADRPFLAPATALEHAPQAWRDAANDSDGATRVASFLAKHYTGVVGSDLRKPIGTITATDHHSLVTALLVKLRGTSTAQSIEDPMHTISAQGTHFAEVRALLKPCMAAPAAAASVDPSLPCTDQALGTVFIDGVLYAVVDIGLRMLGPRELYNAMGFDPEYRIDVPAPVWTENVASMGNARQRRRRRTGGNLTQTAQVRMAGNAVCPPVARALVAANWRAEHLRQAA